MAETATRAESKLPSVPPGQAPSVVSTLARQAGRVVQVKHVQIDQAPARNWRGVLVTMRSGPEGSECTGADDPLDVAVDGSRSDQLAPRRRRRSPDLSARYSMSVGVEHTAALAAVTNGPTMPATTLHMSRATASPSSSTRAKPRWAVASRMQATAVGINVGQRRVKLKAFLLLLASPRLDEPQRGIAGEHAGDSNPDQLGAQARDCGETPSATRRAATPRR